MPAPPAPVARGPTWSVPLLDPLAFGRDGELSLEHATQPVKQRGNGNNAVTEAFCSSNSRRATYARDSV
jgi:hypothetical protein